MKKKFFIILVLFVCLFPLNIRAENRLYFSNEEINIAPGEKKKIDVIVESDGDFTEASFNVITTSSYISFYSVDVSKDFERKDGRGFNLISKTPMKSGTVIASVVLKASDSASIGTTGLVRLIESSITTSQKNNLSINQVKVTVSNEKSNNNNLLSLTSSLAKIEFSKDVTEYNVTVDSNVNEFDLVATPEDSSATVSISDQKLKAKSSNIIVSVTAQNGDKKEYKITVSKKSKEVTSKKNNENVIKKDNKYKKENYKSKWIIALISLLVIFIFDILYMKKKK